MKVQDVMCKSVATCTMQDCLNDVAQKLWEHDCGCLPVVDGDERPLAVVTDRDICMAAFTTGKTLPELRVAGAMSKHVVTCRPQEELAAAAARMAKHGVRRLPVVEGTGKLIGILSINDLANSAANDALRVLQAVSSHRAAVPTAAAPPPPPSERPPERSATRAP